jgi:hypothetical protein
MRSGRMTAYSAIIAWSTSLADRLLRRKPSAKRVTRQELIIVRSSVDAFGPMHSSNAASVRSGHSCCETRVAEVTPC